MFLPACASLMLVGNLIAQLNGLHYLVTYPKHRSDKTQANTCKTLSRQGGFQAIYQTRMLFMQFTNEMVGPPLHLKKEQKYITLLKNKLLLALGGWMSNKALPRLPTLLL